MGDAMEIDEFTVKEFCESVLSSGGGLSSLADVSFLLFLSLCLTLIKYRTLLKHAGFDSLDAINRIASPNENAPPPRDALGGGCSYIHLLMRLSLRLFGTAQSADRLLSLALFTDVLEQHCGHLREIESAIGSIPVALPPYLMQSKEWLSRDKILSPHTKQCLNPDCHRRGSLKLLDKNGGVKPCYHEAWTRTGIKSCISLSYTCLSCKARYTADSYFIPHGAGLDQRFYTGMEPEFLQVNQTTWCEVALVTQWIVAFAIAHVSCKSTTSVYLTTHDCEDQRSEAAIQNAERRVVQPAMVRLILLRRRLARDHKVVLFCRPNALKPEEMSSNSLRLHHPNARAVSWHACLDANLAADNVKREHFRWDVCDHECEACTKAGEDGGPPTRFVVSDGVVLPRYSCGADNDDGRPCKFRSDEATHHMSDVPLYLCFWYAGQRPLEKLTHRFCEHHRETQCICSIVGCKDAVEKKSGDLADCSMTCSESRMDVSP